MYYYAVDHQSTGDWQRMVFGEDGAVYLENPINSIYTQTWIKGYRTEGDTIAFQLPQAIFSEEDVFSGDTRYGYLERVRPGERNGKQTLVPNEDPADQVLKYVWHGDSLKMVLPEGELIGMCLPADHGRAMPRPPTRVCAWTTTQWYHRQVLRSTTV